MKEAYNLVTYVPETHADAVRHAMGEAGAGKVGNYTFCSFSSNGTGRFKPMDGAHPSIGEVGRLEEVAEERIEAVCEKELMEAVAAAIRKAHPYEEVPIYLTRIEIA